jgi:hypothetical protein
LHLDNIVVFLIKNQDSYLTNEDINNLSNVNGMYQEMVNNVLRLRSIDFSKLKLPRLDYAEQTRISQERVDLATACAIYYGLNTGMVVRYLKGEYVGESRNPDAIIEGYPLISAMLIASISRESLIRDAHCILISAKIMITNIWFSIKGAIKLFFSSRK